MHITHVPLHLCVLISGVLVRVISVLCQLARWDTTTDPSVGSNILNLVGGVVDSLLNSGEKRSLVILNVTLLTQVVNAALVHDLLALLDLRLHHGVNCAAA
jgi:hypothetical protein